MVEVLIRENEGCAPDPSLLWDSQWFPTEGIADWRMAGNTQPLNVGGLIAIAGLATATFLCLFTDLRCPAGHPLAYLADGDPRGWWGDGVDVRADLGEAPLGSLLWLLERAPMVALGTPITTWAQQFATEALAPLLAQGAVVKIVVNATADQAAGRLCLDVQMFGENGTQVYNAQFELLWQQLQ